MKRYCRGGLVLALLVVSAALVSWTWVGASSDTDRSVGSVDASGSGASPFGTQALAVASTVAAKRDASAGSGAGRSGGDPQSGDPAAGDGDGTDLPFDMHAVMERIHFAFRPGTDRESVLEGGHSTYGVRVEQGAFEVRAFHMDSNSAERSARPADDALDVSAQEAAARRPARRARESAPVTFETVALGRADDASDLSPLPPAAARVESDGHLSWVRADHVEHLRNGADGVEQSWSFSQRPAGRGDLIVRVAAEGLPVAGLTDGGLHFADATGFGLRYGHATWVSGDGARTPVPVAWRAGAIELHVPSGVLDTSAYPAVLDPTVGPEFGMDEPVWVSAPGSASDPRVASNGAGYLVVWEDGRAGEFRIYGARVSLTGILQDDTGLALTPYVTWATSPAIATAGTDYLVVWEDGMIGSEARILGTRVTNAGVVLEPESFVIADAAELQGAPSVASNGAGYLVVWHDGRNGTQWDIFGARVTVSGVVEDPSGFGITTAPGSQSNPAVASNGDDYLVAWTDYRTGAEDVYATRVSSLGVVLDAPSFAVSTAANAQYGVSVASDGSDYFVAWTDRRAGSAWEVYGTRVTSNGVVQDPAGLVVSHAPVVPRVTSVASDGTHYFVVWSQASGGTRGIYGARVASAGTLLDSPGVLIGATTSSATSVAFDGSNYLVAWEGPDSGVEISTTRVTTDVAVLDPMGVPIRTEANGQSSPAVAFNGTDYLVVWYDGRGGREVDEVYGVRVSSAGAVRDTLGIRIPAAESLRFALPAVASNGSSFLVGWLEAEQYGSNPQLWTSLVSSAGTVAPPTRVARVVGRSGTLHLASNGSDYLAVWGERTSPNLRRNYAARIAADGSLLEPLPIELGVWWVDRSSPVAASNGTDYLVVWTEGQAPTSSLRGTRLGPSGLPQDPEGLLIATNLHVIGQPSIASNGEDYLVTWAQAGGAAQGVYGTRVMSSGAPQDSNPFLLGEVAAYCSDVSPSVAYSGVDYLVLWCAAVEDSAEIRAAEVGRDGSVASRALVATIAGNYSHGTSLALSAGSPGQALVVYGRHVDVVSRVFGRLLSTLDADGSACSEGAACETGHCVDGVCCDSVCGGGDSTDCQACVASLTGLADGVCSWVPADAPCGDATVADCDAADTCDAVGICQPNLATAGSPCGDSSSTACTLPDTCDASGTCMAHDAPDGTSCEAGLFCVAGDTCSEGTCHEGALAACAAEEKCSELEDRCFPACGDGVRDPGEACDHGGLNSDVAPNACRTSCTLAGCGDGVVDPGEGCDEGARNADVEGATCRTNCAPATCGDGILDSGEACDRGAMNSSAPDASCRVTCVSPSCGDSIRDTGEECDDGPSNSDTQADACRSACRRPSCGDGVRDTGEACDDGPLGSTSCPPGCGTAVLDGGVVLDANVTLDAGPAPDLGDDADVTADSGLAPDASLLPDAGRVVVSGGGCGCRVAAQPDSESPLGARYALLFVVVLVAFRRRRPRRSLLQSMRGSSS